MTVPDAASTFQRPETIVDTIRAAIAPLVTSSPGRGTFFGFGSGICPHHAIMVQGQHALDISCVPVVAGPSCNLNTTEKVDPLWNSISVMTEHSPQTSGRYTIDALMPPEMALACESAGATKAGRDPLALFVLGVLAGAFIAFGADFMTVVSTGSNGMPWGVARLCAGLVFSLGLILVIIGGAELFTGDALMIVAFASRRISITSLLRAWALVYLGNIVGAVGTAILVFAAAQHGFAGGAVGRTALAIAAAKAALPTVQLFFLAVLCNVLVCLAVWMSFSARTVTIRSWRLSLR